MLAAGTPWCIAAQWNAEFGLEGQDEKKCCPSVRMVELEGVHTLRGPTVHHVPSTSSCHGALMHDADPAAPPRRPPQHVCCSSSTAAVNYGTCALPRRCILGVPSRMLLDWSAGRGQHNFLLFAQPQQGPIACGAVVPRLHNIDDPIAPHREAVRGRRGRRAAGGVFAAIYADV